MSAIPVTTRSSSPLLAVIPVTLDLPRSRSGGRESVTALTRRLHDAASAWFDVRPILVPWAVTRVAVTTALAFAALLGTLPGLTVPSHYEAAPRALDPFLRYDAERYLTIATEGYEADRVVFFPVFPLLIRMLAPLMTAPLAAIALSQVAFFVALAACHRLLREELGAEGARRGTWALCLWPMTVFFSMPYTESLFLALAALTLLASRRQRVLGAGVIAGIACLTRVTGAALMLAVVIETLGRRGSVRSRLVALASLAPGALLALAFPTWQWLRFGSPSLFLSGQSHWKRAFEWPLTAILQEVSFVLADLEPIRWLVYLPTLVAIAGLFCLGAQLRTWSLAPWIYGTTAILMGIVNPVHDEFRHPLTSLDRYVLLAFPALCALVRLLPGRRSRIAVAVVSGVLAAILALLLGLGAFIE